MAQRDPFYRLLDKEYNESLERYTPNEEHFYGRARKQLPSHWRIDRGDIWFMCHHPDTVIPLQGWKIHVSTKIDKAADLLDIVVAYLADQNDTAFKFALDRHILGLLMNKGWSRGASGKFITIYPPSQTKFKSILHDLHARTAVYRGAYILSDRRYADSQVLYYRYGGMALRRRMNLQGEHVPVLVRPDGGEIPDVRSPFFSVPLWAEDPFPAEDTAEDANTLHDGQFIIQSVLAFTNAGGIYKAAESSTGRRVLIKEARPCVYAAGDIETCELLKKEFRLLKELEHENVAPQPIAFFQDWEHHFLAEEFVEGTVLVDFFVRASVFLKTRPTSAQVREYYHKAFSLYAELARMLERIHAHGIVFGDFSGNNIIVSADGRSAKFIDFEGASQQGSENAGALFTPGFAPNEMVYDQLSDFKSDCYSFGALISSSLMPINSLNVLKPGATAELLAEFRKEYSMPLEFIELLMQLLSPAREDRPTAGEARKRLQELADGMERRNVTVIRSDYQWEGAPEMLVGEIASHIVSAGDTSRKDRLFPGDVRLFNTNPLSIAYGAGGVLYALKKCTGEAPAPFSSWLMDRLRSGAEYPPGLYVGLSGIAWSLLELGCTEEAVDVYRRALRHSLIHDGVDVFYGMAGFGLAALKFFAITREKSFLDEAIHLAVQILARPSHNAKGTCWEDSGDIPLGYAHGASGIALFLLYLYYATGDRQFLQEGHNALAHDLSCGYQNEEGALSWPYTVARLDPILPYWRHGSSGVGSVALRYWHCTGEISYAEVLEKIYLDTDRKYAIFPGRFYGLSGIGDFLMDCHKFTGQDRFLNSARKIANGLRLFAIRKKGQTAFPGDGLLRISCDYGTGSAGIMLFLHRLNTISGPDFLVDELLPEKGQILFPVEHAADGALAETRN
jgi:serine/threonine protein kinase